jgi:hypothetical protein
MRGLHHWQSIPTRGQGTRQATAMISTSALTDAGLKKAPAISLTVHSENANAIGFYEKLGNCRVDDRIWVDNGANFGPSPEKNVVPCASDCAISKNIFSRPAGATEISMRTGLPLSFLNECGQPAGMSANIPALATTLFPSTKNVISPSMT